MSTKLEGKAKDVRDVTVQRQCEWEYLDQIEDEIFGMIDLVARGD